MRGVLRWLRAVVLFYEPLAARWLEYWHGVGEPWQYQFFRCYACRRIVTHRLIRLGGCRCQESIKVSPAKLTRGEKARLLFLPWTITPRNARTLEVAR